MRSMQKNAVLKAIIYGASTGLIAVLIFIAVLRMPVQDGGTLLAVDGEEEMVDVQQEQYYAQQHGVYSTEEGATAFVAGHPFLNKSAIVKVDEQFFIWSKVSNKKAELVPTVPASFYKTFTLSSSCPQPGLNELPSILKNEKWLNISFVQDEATKNLPNGWELLIPEVAKLSNDVDVVRLHVLNQYLGENTCLKISF